MDHIRQISLKLPEKLLEHIAELCKLTGRTRTKEIIQALRFWIPTETKRIRAVTDTLDDKYKVF